MHSPKGGDMLDWINTHWLWSCLTVGIILKLLWQIVIDLRKKAKNGGRNE